MLRDYPNSMYYNGIDFAIQAGGYNSFHEMRNLGIPTLFYPNMNTGMDDQLARCKVAEDEQWGLVLLKRTEKSISSSISKLLVIQRGKKPTIQTGSSVLANHLRKWFFGKGFMWTWGKPTSVQKLLSNTKSE